MQPDSIAGRYRVVRSVGRGGMGTVWLCTDEVLHRQVAVKQIGSLPGESPGDTARAMREARLAAALNHRNAVSIYDVVEHDGMTWLVMEYVPSQTLSQLLAAEGRLPPERVARLGAQVAAALTSAHALGIIHRDIKPGNILVGEGDVAKISDFGIARGHQDAQLTQTGMVTGTPAFFSPELARGEDPTFASDVWAFGVTLYTATEGAPPYAPQSNPLAILSAITRGPLPPPTHAGPLTQVLDAALNPDASRRATMAETLASLREIERHTASATSSGSAVPGVIGVAEAPERPDQTSIIESPAEPAYEKPVTVPAVAVADTRSDRWVVEEPPPPRGRSTLNRLAMALLALLVLAGTGALLWNTLDLGAGDGTEPTSASSSDTAGDNAGAASSQDDTDPGTGQSDTSDEPADTPDAEDPTTEPTEPSPATAPAAFTRSYYRTVSEDLDAGWDLIAPSMQQSVGRDSYDSFWESVESVNVSNIEAVDDETVTYTITYTLVDGSQSVENKQLTLRSNGGSYLITSDTAVG